MESSDGHDVEEIKQLVNETLANNRDVAILSMLVEYYLSSRSQRCLDVLVAIREPNHKYLFDKLHECLKGKARHDTLKLIMNIVPRQPSWLHHITSHKVLSHILAIIRSEQEAVHIMLASTIIFSLMPLLPVQYGASALPETFESFSALAALCTRKPSPFHESHMKFLKLGLQILFQYLYGMYPCNFLAYLRGYYGSQDHSRESLTVYTKTIRPLLQRTRVHPLLVTASKQAELSLARWRKMQPYDILVECGQHYLDPTERSNDSGEPSSPPPIGMAASPLPLLQLPMGGPSAQGGFVMTPSVLSTPCWSPMEACGLAPAWKTVGRPLSYEGPYETREVSLPLDVAVEATPEETVCIERAVLVPRCEMSRNAASAAKDEVPLRDPGNKAPLQHGDAPVAGARAEKSAPLAVASGVLAGGSETPFFSTTNNLTTEPHKSVSELPEYQEHQRLAHSMDRLRYFSQCPVRCCNRGRSPLERSRSCPRLRESSVRPKWPAEGSTQGEVAGADLPPDDGPVALAAEACVEAGDCIQEEPPQAAAEPEGRSLLSYSVHRGADQGSGDASSLALADMSPSELLEKHLQLVSRSYMQQAALAKKGAQQHGAAAPEEDRSEEVEALKGQVSLLYVLLLYERHRRDVHIERNRRLLAKAKKIVALEEQTAAYKDQLFLLELEMKKHKEKLEESSLEIKRGKAELAGTVRKLEGRIAELHTKNEVLSRENRSLAEQLRHSEATRVALQQEVNRNADDLLELDMELETARSRAAMSSSYRQQVESLQKELITLGEMYKRLEARLQASEPRPQVEAQAALLQEAALHEVAGVRHQLEAKQIQVDSLSSRVRHLEATLSNRDARIHDLKDQFARMDAIHKEQLKSKEVRIAALSSLCQRMEVHLVEARYCSDQKRGESGSEASGGFDDVCASMELEGNSPTVNPSGLLGSYTSHTDMTPVSDMLKEAEQALGSPERRVRSSVQFEELELAGMVGATAEKPQAHAAGGSARGLQQAATTSEPKI